MKNLKNYLVILTMGLLTLILSCEKNIDDECGCVKESYRNVPYICYDENTGLPQTCFSISQNPNEDVECQDEREYQEENGTFVTIKCN